MVHNISLVICLLSLVSLPVMCDRAKLRIAVVGGGIGGTSVCFFLHELLQDQISIDVYEPHEIGGRLATAQVGNLHYETGGSIIHEDNLYVRDFMRRFNLTPKTDSKTNVPSKFGLYDGSEFLFKEASYEWLTAVKLLYRYGPLNFYRFQQKVNEMLQDFSRIYVLQNEKKSFLTVQSLLRAMSDRFVPQLSECAEDGMKNVTSLLLLTELVSAGNLVNYGQSIYNMPEFVTYVSCAGMSGKLFSIRGGNKQLAERLLNACLGNLLRRKVTKIVFQEKTGTYVVSSVQTKHGSQNGEDTGRKNENSKNKPRNEDQKTKHQEHLDRSESAESYSSSSRSACQVGDFNCKVADSGDQNSGSESEGYESGNENSEASDDNLEFRRIDRKSRKKNEDASKNYQNKNHLSNADSSHGLRNDDSSRNHSSNDDPSKNKPYKEDPHDYVDSSNNSETVSSGYDSAEEIPDSSDWLEKEYDYVVMATPLSLSDIVFANMDTSRVNRQVRVKYHTTVTTLVQGQVNATLTAGGINEILLVRPGFLNSLSLLSSTSGDNSANVYKVFSQRALGSRQLDQLFQEGKYEVRYVKEWKAYPQYSCKSEKEKSWKTLNWNEVKRDGNSGSDTNSERIYGSDIGYNKKTERRDNSINTKSEEMKNNNEVEKSRNNDDRLGENKDTMANAEQNEYPTRTKDVVEISEDKIGDCNENNAKRNANCDENSESLEGCSKNEACGVSKGYEKKKLDASSEDGECGNLWTKDVKERESCRKCSKTQIDENVKSSRAQTGKEDDNAGSEDKAGKGMENNEKNSGEKEIQDSCGTKCDSSGKKSDIRGKNNDDGFYIEGNFVLNKRLYYVNVIELAASAMEMSAIGAKNVALLLFQDVMND